MSASGVHGSNEEHTWTQLLGELDCSNDVQRRAGTKVETFRIEQVIDHLYGLLVGYVQRAREVIHEGTQVVRDTTLADTLALFCQYATP